LRSPALMRANCGWPPAHPATATLGRGVALFFAADLVVIAIIIAWPGLVPLLPSVARLMSTVVLLSVVRARGGRSRRYDTNPVNIDGAGAVRCPNPAPFG
jgi:hypothetical protein